MLSDVGEVENFLTSISSWTKRQVSIGYVRRDWFFAQEWYVWFGKATKGLKSFEKQMGIPIKNDGDKQLKYKTWLIVKCFEQQRILILIRFSL